MLNVNEKMDCMEIVEERDNFEEETQSQFEFYNLNYNVNFFGVGRSSEDWHWEYKAYVLETWENSLRWWFKKMILC